MEKKWDQTRASGCQAWIRTVQNLLAGKSTEKNTERELSEKIPRGKRKVRSNSKWEKKIPVARKKFAAD